MNIDDMFNVIGWLSLIIGILSFIIIYIYHKKYKPGTTDFRTGPIHKRKMILFVVIIIIILLFSFSSLLATFFVGNVQYESKVYSTFDIYDQSEVKRGSGTFLLTSDGPLTAQRECNISWIRIGSLGDDWIQSLGFYVEDIYGDGSYYIRFDKSDWNETTGLNLDLSSEINNFIDTEPIIFNSEGIVSFKIQMIYNETIQNNWYLKITHSSDITIENRAVWEAYQNKQLQTGSLIIGVVMIAVPVTFKNFIEIADNLVGKFD